MSDHQLHRIFYEKQQFPLTPKKEKNKTKKQKQQSLPAPFRVLRSSHFQLFTVSFGISAK